MKKNIKLILSVLALLSLFACVPNNNLAKNKEEISQTQNKGEVLQTQNKDVPTIAIVQLVEHTSLNIIYDSIIKQLENLGYKDNEGARIIYKNAQGEMANITSIMQNLEGENIDILVPITTPVAQASMKLAQKVPVVFTAVSDPVKAGIVSSFELADKGMTGTCDLIQVDKILDLARKITPDIKTVGYIYNPGEDNSVSNLEKLEAYINNNGLKLISSSITTSSELQSASSSLLQKVDAIFVANDNTVAEAMPILVSLANKAKIPVYVGADSMVMDGGFATVGIDYVDLGKETANMVDEILKGKKTSEIPVKVFKDNLNIYVNKNTKEALGIEIPEDILKDDKFIEITNK